MRILLTGSDKVYAIENHYINYLRLKGEDVQIYPCHSIFSDYYHRNICNKLSFRLRLSSIYRQINNELKQRILSDCPDVVWVFKGMEIFRETLEWIKARNIKVVNYNPDNPFLFSGKGSGNKNISQSFSLYDLHFTYNREVQLKLESEYNCKTFYLPFGYDVNEQLYERIAQEQEIVSACFVGNPDKERASFIKQLADEGINLHVYGSGWNRFVNDTKITVHQQVLGEELFFTLRKYRVQLNLMRPHNPHSHNMRTFEVPGVGGIMVAPNTYEHRSFFEDRKEAFFFNSLNDCISLINEVLQLPSSEATKIRNVARLRSVRSGYSYEARTNQALQAIKHLTK
jgi:spore maturation protein CgeB